MCICTHTHHAPVNTSTQHSYTCTHTEIDRICEIYPEEHPKQYGVSDTVFKSSDINIIGNYYFQIHLNKRAGHESDASSFNHICYP